MTACDNGSADTFCTTSGNSPPILDAGLDYIERRGWPVLPLYPRRKNPYQPAGYKELPPLTPDELRRYFDETPDLNIGMHTGHGIIVIDVDEKPGKMSWQQGPGGPRRLTRQAPGDTHEPDWRWRSPTVLPPTTGLRAVRRSLAGSRRMVALAQPAAEPSGVIDIRNDGLVVLPPSIHPDGPRYRWEDPDVDHRYLAAGLVPEARATPLR